MSLSSCDDDRLTIASEAKQKLEQARVFAKNGEYASALECYLFAFDNSLLVDGWGGVRLSYIPSEIAELGMKYPAATTALQQRRDAREAMIRSGETDYNVLAEWSAINRYLYENDRGLQLLKELDENKTLSDSVKEKIVRENFDRLLERREYSLLGEYLNYFGRMFFWKIFNYEECRIFPKRFNRAVSALEMFRNSIAEEGSRVYELALGLGKYEQADGVAEQVLKYDTCAESYSLLIGAAERAGKKRKANALRKRAKLKLATNTHEDRLPTTNNDETEFLKIMTAAFRRRNFSSESFAPALKLLTETDGVEACICADFEGNVLVAKAAPEIDATVLALECATIYRNAKTAVSELNRGAMESVILRTVNGEIAMFNLDAVLLIVVSDGSDNA